ncbi:MAG TPA: alpha/beta hydrolase [Aquabacterium sp.]|nr:alpha/beta hydrolase [Aquabacterium sp.]HSW05061.1 alpha/beta hydrolase [Aquabacterium sp.]
MSASSAQPLVVHFHAGTFVSGDLDSGSVIGHLLAEAGAVVMSVDYPLAPAHPFPAAVEAGHAALAWAWRYRGRLAGAGAPVYLAGEEAGGNLAAAIGLKSRDLQRPLLAGQILLSPMLDTCVATASLRSAKAGPVGCRWADGWHDYLQRPDDAMHPYAAPGRAMRLSLLPRTLLVTAEDDPMRDETRAFASRLRDAGVPVDEALLTAVTGWPCSFMDSASRGAAWISPLRERLQRFLATQPEP